MSALSQFVGGGNKIKSIQRGTAAVSSTPSPISISAVNTSKSIVYFNSQQGYGSGLIYSNGFSITLSSSTSVTISGGSYTTTYLSFEVVEFY